jgi:endoglucanase
MRSKSVWELRTLALIAGLSAASCSSSTATGGVSVAGATSGVAGAPSTTGGSAGAGSSAGGATNAGGGASPGGGAASPGGAGASAGAAGAATGSAGSAAGGSSAGGGQSVGGAAGQSNGGSGGSGSTVMVDGSPAAWHCVNWAVNGDNFQTGPLLLSGVFTTDTSYAAVAARAKAVEDAYSDLLKANSFRIPINEPTVNTASYWANYKAIIDVGVSKGMKVLLGFWAKDTNIGRPADINVWYSMWQTVISDYIDSPYVFFDIHNEPHGYTNSEWIQQVKDWMAKFPNVPKNRIVVAGTGWDDNVANVATAFPDMPLLEVHDYVFNGNYPGSAKWGQQLLGRLGSGTSRTLVGEFGTGVANVDFSTGVETDPGKSFVVGFTNTIHDNNMGSCWWPGLWAVPGNSSSWGLLTMNGSGNDISYSISSQTALTRIWHGWHLN